MAGPTLFRPSDISAALQGFWKLGETSGSRADSSGNANTLTDNNTVLRDAEDYWNLGEGSADFEAANSEFLSISDAAQTGLDIAGNFTFAALIKVESKPGNRMILAKSNNGGVGYEFFIKFTTGAVGIRIDGPEFLSDTLLKDGQWYHIAVVYDGVAVTHYINGNVDKVTAHTSNPTDNANDFNLGAVIGANHFDGLLKDVGMWNTALTSIEIKSLALGSNLSSLGFRPDSVSTQPTSWWKLNEKSDGTAKTRVDTSGSNNLTDINTVRTLGGYIDGAGADFEAANTERLTITDAAQTNLDIAGTYSIVGWFKFESVGQRTLYSKWNNNPGLLFTLLNATQLAVFHAGGAATVTFNIGITIAADTWYHIGVVYDTTANTAKLYIDGFLEDSQAESVDPSANSEDVFLGASGTGTDDPMDGLMSDVAIWNNYAVTSAEMASLASGIPIQQQGIVSYWKQDEASGTRFDAIGPNDLTDNNTVGNGAGKVGNAGDYISANSEHLSRTDAAQVDLDLSDRDFTIMTWVKFDTFAGNPQIIDKEGSLNGYSLSAAIAPNLRFHIRAVALNSITTLVTGVFFHGVGIFTGAESQIYLDSVREATALGIILPVDNAKDFNLGAFDGGSSNFFDGLMDETIIAKRYFREEEVKTIYNKGLNGKEATSEEVSAGPGAGIQTRGLFLAYPV